MPGISFMASADCGRRGAALGVHGGLRHLDHFRTTQFLCDAPFFLAATHYANYPLHFFENSQNAVLLEGRIYGVPDEQIRETLESIASVVVQDDRVMDTLAPTLRSMDGDFIIWIYDKIRNAVYILNDQCGRLPFYYYAERSEVIASRDWMFVMGLVPEPRFDRMGIALFLLFTFTAGKTTIWKDVRYLEGGSVLRIDLKTGSCACHRINVLNFEALEASTGGGGDAIDLSTLFRNAALRRLDVNSQNVLGLSGGLDSRAVAAALSGANVRGVSRLSIDGRERGDVQMARLVAATSGMEWELVEPRGPAGSDYLKLLRLKGGLNSLEMCFNVPFSEALLSRFGGNLRYFTGDGGDRVKPHYQGVGSVSSLESLSSAVVKGFGITSVELVAKLTKLSEGEIVDWLRAYLRECPERSYVHKYMHFQIYESAFKWVFEGEDRNRCYFWSVTPFYGADFFQRVMETSDRKKWNYELYRKFLVELSPALGAIPLHPWAVSIVSPAFRLRLLASSILNRLPGEPRKWLRRISPSRAEPVSDRAGDLIRRLCKSSKNTGLLDDYFDVNAIGDYLAFQPGESRKLNHAVLTLTSAIELTMERKSIFEDAV